jgi:chromosome segregation ATPase
LTIKKKEHEYESQLIQSQSHIVYLEGMINELNNRPAPTPEPANHNSCHREISSLQEEIEKYRLEIEEWKSKNDEVHSYLVRAEDYILQLQNQQPQSPEKGP